MSQAVGCSGVLTVQVTKRTTGGSPSQLTATLVSGAKVVRTFTTSEQLRSAFGLKAPWVTAITACELTTGGARGRHRRRLTPGRR